MASRQGRGGSRNQTPKCSPSFMKPEGAGESMWGRALAIARAEVRAELARRREVAVGWRGRPRPVQPRPPRRDHKFR